MMQFNRRSALAAALAAMGAPGLALAASAGGTGVEAPFRVTRNQPWTGVTINGKEPLAFLIDTGSNGFAITPEAAAKVGLKPITTSQVQGVVGRGKISIYQANELIIGGAMRQREVILGSVGLGSDALVTGLIPIAKFGAMGLDFERQMLLIAPGLDALPDGYEKLETIAGGDDPRSMSNFGRHGNDEMTQNGLDQRPVVQGMFDGEPINLLLDTGSPSSLLLRPDYVHRRGLWDHYAKSVDTSFNSVVRGAKGRMVRAEKLRIGRYGFAKPVVLMGDPAERAHDGTERIDGIVGMELLRRFNFINHADRHAFYIKPNPALGDGYRYDRAGLYVDLDDKGAVAVLWVRDGGPASKAGLKVGDKVTGWKGQGGYQGLMWALSGAPGSTVDIEIERGGAKSMVQVTLEDVV